MVHPKFDQLVKDGVDTLFIAELLHCVMHDEGSFVKATRMVNSAKDDGVLKNVKFYPPSEALNYKEEKDIV